MRNFNFCAYLLLILLLIGSCSKSPDIIPYVPVVTDTTSLPMSSPLIENFETGNKEDYPSSTIQLSSGKWNLDNAMIGTLSSDKKNGEKSVRIKETGKLSMNFDVINGVYSVIISNAAYANDQASDYELWASYNSGFSYSKVGSTVTTSITGLRQDIFVVNTTGRVRFSIHKVTNSGQLNIDDFEVVLTTPPPVPATADNDNMLMGNPSNATTSVITENNYFMDKTYYALSYNREQGKPNWVSWHLQMSDFGTTPRQDDFREDFSLPTAWYHVTNFSYSGSGFDRGHGCPSADRTSSVAANSSTFLMTNMIPQAPQNNQFTWSRLEDSCRMLVHNGSELFIISGSTGIGGNGNNGDANTIDNGNVVVPAYVWKVIVVLPNGNNDLLRVNTSTRVIAVLAANRNGVIGDWKTYRVSVDNIESVTGYNLLSNLSTTLQATIEARIDNL